MGNYKARRPGFIEGWKQDAALYMFQGLTDEEIVHKIWPRDFDLTLEEKRRKLNLRRDKQRLQNLRKDEKFLAYYRSIVTEWSVHYTGPALNKLAEQMNDPSGWLANKAANDVLQRAMPVVMGNEANTVTVKIEGMPELGSPDQEES